MRRSAHDLPWHCFPLADCQRHRHDNEAHRSRRGPGAGTSWHDGHPPASHVRSKRAADAHVDRPDLLGACGRAVCRAGRHRTCPVHRKAASAARPGTERRTPRHSAPRPRDRRRRALPGRAGRQRRGDPGPLRRVVPVCVAVHWPRHQTALCTGCRLGTGLAGAGLPAAALAPGPFAASAAGPQPQLGRPHHAWPPAGRHFPDRVLPRPAVDELSADRAGHRPAGTDEGVRPGAPACRRDRGGRAGQMAGGADDG
ncbi:hypothetical protein D9M72_282550 [compost metagenome]